MPPESRPGSRGGATIVTAVVTAAPRFPAASTGRTAKDQVPEPSGPEIQVYVPATAPNPPEPNPPRPKPSVAIPAGYAVMSARAVASLIPAPGALSPYTRNP